MLLNLTDISEEPLQSQISRQIREKILSGELLPETNLPSIRGLARKQHVSVITVQRAYEVLINEGLIHSRRGKGFFVSEIAEDSKQALAEERLVENIQFYLQSALAEGLKKERILKIVENLLNVR